MRGRRAGLVGERQGSASASTACATERRDGGDVVAEVKSRGEGRGHGESGFKVRGVDGKLLWKVKIGARR